MLDLRECCRAGQSSDVFIGRTRHAMVTSGAFSAAVVVRVHGRCGWRGAAVCFRAAVVVRPAERHDRSYGTLGRNRQNQQPDQKRPNQQTHLLT